MDFLLSLAVGGVIGVSGALIYLLREKKRQGPKTP